MKIKKGKLVLLQGKDKSYLIPCQGKFSCKYGAVDLDKLSGKRFGTQVKIGKKKFSVINPGIRDIMFKKFERGPQVILPEDGAMIAAFTGIGKGSKVIESGTGSGFLTSFLTNLGCEVTSYEKNKIFFTKAKKNINKAGLRATIKNKDITKSRLPSQVDLVVLDMQYPEQVIKKAWTALKPGGHLAVYSLHVEQLQRVVPRLKNFQNIKIVECLQRRWQVEGKTYTRPKTHMLGHTGFLVFARKI